jgi:hypothetical protein
MPIRNLEKLKSSNVGQTDERWLGCVEVQAAVIPASINAFGEGQIGRKLLTNC